MNLVSVIIPAYNAQDKIRASLASVLRQSLKDIEVIVVDDGSRDGTVEIVNSFVKRDPRVRLISQSNAGPGHARNTGLQHACAPWIFFVDADDTISPLCLESSLIAVQKHDAQIVIIDSNIEAPELELQNISHQELDAKTAITSLAPAAWGKLYSAKLFDANNIYFPGLRAAEDVATVPQLIATSKKTMKIFGVTYRYRPTSEGISRDPPTMVPARFKAIEWLIHRFQALGKFDEFKAELEYLTFLHGLKFQIPSRIFATPPISFRAAAFRSLANRHFPHIFENDYVLRDFHRMGQHLWPRLLKSNLYMAQIFLTLPPIKHQVRRRLGVTTSHFSTSVQD